MATSKFRLFIYVDDLLFFLDLGAYHACSNLWIKLIRNRDKTRHYFTSELEEQLQKFVSYYNHERYHESLNNLTPADVFYGRGEEIFDEREMIKQNTKALRKQMHYDKKLSN